MTAAVLQSRWIEWLISIIKKHSVDMLIPSIEVDMSFWNKNRAQIEDAGVCILLNNPELIELCLDKWEFYQKLVKSKFRYRIETSITPNYEQFNVPFVLKPRCGYGGRGYVLVERREVFEEYKEEIGKKLIMQEYVGMDSEEYTVSAFFDKKSNLRACIALKRRLSKQGFTEIAEVVELEGVEEIIRELAKIFFPVGPTNFQFRRHKNEFRLLEINPRISSSTSIRSAFGYNESKMSVEYFLQGKNILRPLIKTGKAIRYIEDYIFYDSSDF